MEKLQSLKMQTLKKQKSSPLKYRNEPSRFFGDGAVFKAKLIGILEVGEARGDRMCQEALQDLKMAIRAAGEHKQKITIHVTIEGLRLRDEKTGDSLYHHPVHKISFIAQDMTDSRAFGYIFGSPDSGHRFFGIKTDKAASQVVLAMRDLFQVVFELKKKEIELARQHIQNKITQHEHQVAIAALTNKSDPSSSSSTVFNKNGDYKGASKEKSPESVADLVDLEQELNSIQRGISQMERITPSDPTPKSIVDRDDPFGDSFISSTPYNLLPPPELISKRQQKSSPIPRSDEPLAELAQVLSKAQAPLATTDEDWLANTPPASATEMRESISYGEDIVNAIPPSATTTTQTNAATKPLQDIRNISDVFTELDPLGTGKIKPYVDKKYFFQDLKNPPKKVLKDLSQDMPAFDTNFRQDTMKDVTASFDPFTHNDTATEDTFSSIDPFDCFESPSFSQHNQQQQEDQTPNSVYNGGPRLQVNLPPESGGNNSNNNNWGSLTKLERSESISPTPQQHQGIVRNRPNYASKHNVENKQPQILPSAVKLSSRYASRRHQQENNNDHDAPEPPPRPDSIAYSIEPPPLPPKKQFSDIVIRPSAASTTGNFINNEPTRYDFLSGKKIQDDTSAAPPLPLPSRKIGNYRTLTKKPVEDDYLAPLNDNIPTLLPPPQKKDQSKSMNRVMTSSDNNNKIVDEDTDLAEMSVSRLLSLGIDELAKKLSVPVSTVNNMTLMELTKYLSDFIEKSKKPQLAPPTAPEKQPAVFKVNFDMGFETESTTFFAKFDDNFGEDLSSNNKFDVDFEKFKDVKPETTRPPSADRYAILRQIIDSELHVTNSRSSSVYSHESVEKAVEKVVEEPTQQPSRTILDFDKDVEAEINRLSPNLKVGNVEPIINVPHTKIDTKITDAISQAKDRYAALRDIVLVEDLFGDKQTPPPSSADTESNKFEDEENNMMFEAFETGRPRSDDFPPAIHILDHHGEVEDNTTEKIRHTSISKDDVEIDAYMQQAMSNISLDRDHLSPISQNKTPSPVCQQNASTSPIRLQSTKTPPMLDPHKTNDMSTSPIPIQSKSPTYRTTPTSPKMNTASPKPLEMLKKQSESGSLSDVMCESSPEADKTKDDAAKNDKVKDAGQPVNSESWAVFDQPKSSSSPKAELKIDVNKVSKKPRRGRASPCSSDGKDEWKEGNEYASGRRSRPHHTSSSSRDQSPWEEEKENPDYRRERHRYGPPPVRRSHRRINSCDEDYDYPEYDRHQRRKDRTWSPSCEYGYDRGAYPDHRSCWSPNDEEDRRTFDRYERGVYGEPKSLTTYDRREFHKRKYYRERGRTDYPYEEPYEDTHDVAPVRGKRNNYENIYEFDRNARRDYFHSKDTRSFESTESYDRPSSFGSGDLYGGNYDRESRDRYYAEKGRLLKGRNARSKPDLVLDSDNEFSGRRERFESSSLQRQRTKPSPVDDKTYAGKPWKRPGSATEPSGRQIEPPRRPIQNALPQDGEKDRRFRRKGGGGGRPLNSRKEDDYVSNYGTMRGYPARRRDDFYDYDPEEVDESYYPHFYKTPTPRSENRNMNETLKDKRYDYPENNEERRYVKKSSSRDFTNEPKENRFVKFPEEQQQRKRMELDNVEQTSYQNTPPLPAKFTFDETGFESDFAPPPPPAGNQVATQSISTNSKNLKHPEDKSPKNSKQNFANFENFPSNASPSPVVASKLRFNEKVQVSQFNSNSSSANMFEDDFSKTELEEAEDKWNELPTPRLRSIRSPHENIKKSDSINIFAKRNDDPFEDDPFFGGASNNRLNNNTTNAKDSDKWSKNFANFDENM